MQEERTLPSVNNTRLLENTFDDYKKRFPGLFWEYSGDNPTFGPAVGLNPGPYPRLGFVQSDFPGKALIDLVIGFNQP